MEKLFVTKNLDDYYGLLRTLTITYGYFFSDKPAKLNGYLYYYWVGSKTEHDWDSFSSVFIKLLFSSSIFNKASKATNFLPNPNLKMITEPFADQEVEKEEELAVELEKLFILYYDDHLMIILANYSEFCRPLNVRHQ